MGSSNESHSGLRVHAEVTGDQVRPHVQCNMHHHDLTNVAHFRDSFPCRVRLLGLLALNQIFSTRPYPQRVPLRLSARPSPPLRYGICCHPHVTIVVLVDISISRPNHIVIRSRCVPVLLSKAAECSQRDCTMHMLSLTTTCSIRKPLYMLVALSQICLNSPFLCRVRPPRRPRTAARSALSATLTCRGRMLRGH